MTRARLLLIRARLLRPFRVRVLTFEHTRVRVRSFPPLFEHERIESLGERVARGGTVYVEAGEHVIYEPLDVSGSAVGAGRETRIRMEP